MIPDLERTQEVSDIYQREVDSLHRFRVALPYEDCVFNRVVSMNSMKLVGHSVFYVVD